MAANVLGRYVWLVDVLRRYHALSYKEINRLWQESGLSYGEGDVLSLKTFHNHRAAIADIFGLDIVLDKSQKGYKYIIENADAIEKESLRSWLIDSYSVLNQIRIDKGLENRIQFENIPSGNTWLTVILGAMRADRQIRITHHNFQKNTDRTYIIDPYYLKVFSRRWYLVGKNTEQNQVMIYALDRIRHIEILDTKFTLPPDFSIEKYFEGCFGIIQDPDIPVERILIKVFDQHRHYMETLPFHSSQKVIRKTQDFTVYEYRIRPTFDFYQALFAQIDMIEVLEPVEVRKQVKKYIDQIRSLYVL